jgi:hypothetical protein
MSNLHLPPAVRYVYAKVEIDLGSGTVRYSDGHEVALVGQVYEFLDLLLEYPGRVLTYWQIARLVMPEFIPRDRRQQSWNSLDPHQQAAVKRAIHNLAYRTRAILGEKSSRGSILVNRMKLGYFMRRPTHIVQGERETAEVSRGIHPQPAPV